MFSPHFNQHKTNFTNWEYKTVFLHYPAFSWLYFVLHCLPEESLFPAHPSVVSLPSLHCGDGVNILLGTLLMQTKEGGFGGTDHLASFTLPLNHNNHLPRHSCHLARDRDTRSTPITKLTLFLALVETWTHYSHLFTHCFSLPSSTLGHEMRAPCAFLLALDNRSHFRCIHLLTSVGACTHIYQPMHSHSMCESRSVPPYWHVKDWILWYCSCQLSLLLEDVYLFPFI